MMCWGCENLPLDFDSWNEGLRIKQQQMNQPYLFLRELENESVTGMGYDVESLFSCLCINADGEKCMIRERYICFSPKRSDQIVNESNLVEWDLKILPSDPEHQALQKKEYLENKDRLMKPPLAVGLRNR